MSDNKRIGRQFPTQSVDQKSQRLQKQVLALFVIPGLSFAGQHFISYTVFLGDVVRI